MSSEKGSASRRSGSQSHLHFSMTVPSSDNAAAPPIPIIAMPQRVAPSGRMGFIRQQ